MNNSILQLLQKASTYLPLIGTVIILLIATFDSNIFKYVSISLLLAIMAVSFVLTAVYLQTQLQETKQGLGKLTTRVGELEQVQDSYLKAMIPVIQAVSLAQGFQIVSKASRIGHLRVFAISSQQILGFVKFHGFEIERCTVLVRGFSPDDAEHRDFLSQIKLVVRDWRALERQGRIRDLAVRTYDFFPTEYECIFDDQYLLLGLYDSDPDDYSEVRVRNATLVDGVTSAGRQMIAEYTERFDNLFAVCDSHHGAFSYET
jgi:hypothetical protein